MIFSLLRWLYEWIWHIEEEQTYERLPGSIPQPFDTLLD